MYKYKGGVMVQFVYAHELEDGTEIELDVDAHVNDRVEAFLSGPPEKCHEAEGGDCDDWEASVDERLLTDSELEAMGVDFEKVAARAEEVASEMKGKYDDYYD